jgi:hypothetical protein
MDYQTLYYLIKDQWEESGSLNFSYFLTFFHNFFNSIVDDNLESVLSMIVTDLEGLQSDTLGEVSFFSFTKSS